MNIAFFDFDGTITSKNSLADFIQYTLGKGAYFKGLIKLSPILIRYLCKITSNSKAKEKVIAHFFQGWDKKEFQAAAKQYALKKINQITRPKAMAEITWHQQQNHKVVVVSASMHEYLAPWCNTHNIELLATKLEYKNDKLTGNFATKNCHGLEKVARIKAVYDLSNYHSIYAYGDSSGDKALLSIATKTYYKPFR